METTIDDPFPGYLLLLEQAPQSIPFFIGSAIFLVLLLILSGLVSGSEVAFFSLSPNEIDQCKSSKGSTDKRILHLLTNPQKLLATILVLNNLINLTIVTLSTFIVWRVIGERTTDGGIVALLSLVVTVNILIFGEFMPKILASQRNLHFARRTSGLLTLGNRFCKPLSWLLLSLSNVVEKRMAKKAYNVSVDELKSALEIATDTDTTEEEKGILKGIVNFGTLTVKQVMKSRIDITALDIELDFHELMNQINKTGYSRIPVYRETIDKIEGILYIKDLLPHIDKEENFDWTTLLRAGFFVPESKKIDSLFRDFQEKHVHMAIVVDEYGGTSGLITMEDIIEEIVGEINDEFDDEDEIHFNKLDNNTYVFEGKVSLNDFCKILGLDPAIFEEVKGESESLGGLLLELNSKLPNAGEIIRFDRFVFTVVSVDPKRIKRVRVFVNPLHVADVGS